MDVIYQDNGTGQLTGKQLKEIAAMLPDDANIEALTMTNTQRDGWVWQIRAKGTASPHKTSLHRGSARDQTGRSRDIDDL